MGMSRTLLILEGSVWVSMSVDQMWQHFHHRWMPLNSGFARASVVSSVPELVKLGFLSYNSFLPISARCSVRSKHAFLGHAGTSQGMVWEILYPLIPTCLN